MSWNPRGPGPRKPMGRRPDHQPLDKVRAPYNFVPLSELVVEPDWADRVSQDVPFSDGVCGRLDLEITPQGPIFVRGEPGVGGKPDRHFRTPDGLVAIPGSSLRGMIRNVVEIASFGRMRRVNDHRYGVRDLHNRDLYGRHMAAIDPRHKQPVPLVCAGWLERNDGDDAGDFPAVIRPCSFAKVHYKTLMAEAKRRGIQGFDPGRRQSAPSKYRAWGDGLSIRVPVRELFHENPQGGPPRVGSFGVVHEEGTPVAGTLVFTGQPSPWSPDMAPKPSGAGNPKQHDFVFYDPREGTPDALKVSKRVFRDFYFVHADAAEQHRMTDGANEELKFWLQRTGWEKGEKGRIPVFFLLDDQSDAARPELRAIGLAMMFRLAYRYSTRELVVKKQGQDKGHFDLADLIFGHVPLDQREDGSAEHRGLKGRVSIGLARPTGDHRDLPAVKAVLGSPKASYYPSYIEQRPGATGGAPPLDGAGKPVYSTYMDDDARVRGWKRYQQLEGVMQPEPPRDARGKVLDASKVQSHFQPIELREGGFLAPIRIHNLRPVELGALLWALDFGGADRALHGLGMAQSLGYGSVRLGVSGNHLRTIDGEPVDLDRARRAFEDYMEQRCTAAGVEGGWRHSRQIYELIALATPGRPAEDLRHMQINHPAFRNEYQLAKTQGLALTAAGDERAWREAKAGFDRARAEADAKAAAAAEAAALAADPDRADRERLERARIGGDHYRLLEDWMAEGGTREDARRALARQVIGKPSKKLVEKRPALAAWIRGR